MVKASAQRARIVVANSHATANDLRRFLKVPAGRVRLIYEAVDEIFAPISDRDALAAKLATRFSIAEPYLLFVSALYPYKNLNELIRAFAVLSRQHRWNGLLIVAGSDPFGARSESEALARSLGIDQRIRFLGNVPNPELRELYCGAEALVYPSASETFGKPIVEAMRCGTPVIASSAGSIPEIAGDAAMLLDSLAPEVFAARVHELLTDRREQDRLGRAGKTRATAFSWEAVAKGFRAALLEAATGDALVAQRL
jgi:glycosyltransferase involved in cell wall biosynthesis